MPTVSTRGRCRRAERDQRLGAPERKQQTRPPPTARQQQILGEELPTTRARPAPSAAAHRDFLLPVGCARQQHVSNVGAGDQQHESDRAQQHQQAAFPPCRPHSLSEASPRRRDWCPDTAAPAAPVIVAISARACFSVTPGFSRAKMRRLLPPRLWMRSPNAFGTHSSARVAQNGAKWNSGGITPDHGVGLAVECDRPSQHVRDRHRNAAATDETQNYFVLRALLVFPAKNSRPSNGSTPSIGSSSASLCRPTGCSAGCCGDRCQ